MAPPNADASSGDLCSGVANDAATQQAKSSSTQRPPETHVDPRPEQQQQPCTKRKNETAAGDDDADDDAIVAVVDFDGDDDENDSILPQRKQRGGDHRADGVKHGVSPVSYVADDLVKGASSTAAATATAATNTRQSGSRSGNSPAQAMKRRSRAAPATASSSRQGRSAALGNAAENQREQPSVICSIIPTPSWHRIPRVVVARRKKLLERQQLQQQRQQQTPIVSNDGLNTVEALQLESSIAASAEATAKEAAPPGEACDSVPVKAPSSPTSWPGGVDVEQIFVTPMKRTLAAAAECASLTPCLESEDAHLDPEDLEFIRRHNEIALDERRSSALGHANAASCAPSRSPTASSIAPPPTPLGSPVMGAAAPSSPSSKPPASLKKRARVYTRREPVQLFPTPLECARRVAHTQRAHRTGESAADEARQELRQRSQRAASALNGVFAALLEQLPSACAVVKGSSSLSGSGSVSVKQQKRIRMEDDVGSCVSDAIERLEQLIKRQRRASEKALDQATVAEERKVYKTPVVRDGLPERFGVVTIPAGYHLAGIPRDSQQPVARCNGISAQDRPIESNAGSTPVDLPPSSPTPQVAVGLNSSPALSPGAAPPADEAFDGFPKCTSPLEPDNNASGSGRGSGAREDGGGGGDNDCAVEPPNPLCLE
eukprot:CAMPEP_0185848492 /NCGR_PEP_ID=MMETSP1354-20130828/3346_1 /TAXON_ID=708628 /ORGANISM="Erythrolobus madagascarensis, Strain CCMP3276" /LENGTH=660 /DNA_ID=CAMNT_0028548895 /DNA_START=147 /DNA_END=2129 /DNA_ORIENTATION=+